MVPRNRYAPMIIAGQRTPKTTVSRLEGKYWPSHPPSWAYYKYFQRFQRLRPGTPPRRARTQCRGILSRARPLASGQAPSTNLILAFNDRFTRRTIIQETDSVRYRNVPCLWRVSAPWLFGRTLRNGCTYHFWRSLHEEFHTSSTTFLGWETNFNPIKNPTDSIPQQ